LGGGGEGDILFNKNDGNLCYNSVACRQDRPPPLNTACLITMEFCHFTVRQTGRSIDCSYMTRSAELYQGGGQEEGGLGGAQYWKEPMRVFPAVTMLIMAMLVAAAWMQLACAVGGISRGSCINLYNSILTLYCITSHIYIYVNQYET
jgi:hypothetical protein